MALYLGDHDLISEILFELGVQFTRVECIYGWLGSYIPDECFKLDKYRYNILDIAKATEWQDCEWSLQNIQKKRVMSDDLVLCQTKDEGICIYRIHCVVQVYTNYESYIIGLYDFSKNKLLLFSDLNILRCISFDRSIRAATSIKKHWFKYLGLKLESCKVIQRFVIHHLYKPGGVMMKKLKKRSSIHFLHLEQLAVQESQRVAAPHISQDHQL